ncbi:MAG: response regulator [Crocinitomicaceae bacterium]|nr:response regulator [Crocinitomicaceae bacterium]MDG1775757.1 response regulator [Crocinitomicaceae bacterium]
MAAISVLVVENQPITSSNLFNSLTKLGYNVIGTCNTGEVAIEKVSLDIPDIVLMDVKLKGSMDGIKTADFIRLNYSIPVIFYTSYTNEVTLSKAKKTKPYGYLLKPVKDIDLYSTIELAIYKHSKEKEEINNILVSVVNSKKSVNEFIFIKHNSKLVKLYIDEIVYIEALKDYVVIYTSGIKYTVHSTMKNIEFKIGSSKLLRVHRSYIINLNKIKTIEYPFLMLEKVDKNIPIGGSYKNDLNRQIKII